MTRYVKKLDTIALLFFLLFIGIGFALAQISHVAKWAPLAIEVSLIPLVIIIIIKGTLSVTIFLTGSFAVVNASVCTIVPGSVTCGQGTTDSLSGNGMITVNGTTVSGETLVNGVLSADDANFFSLEVNGSAKLTQCTINAEARIKGSLTASSTKFEKKLEIFSSQTRFINSKVNNDLHLGTLILVNKLFI